MNVVREISRLNEKELKLEVNEKISWHSDYAESAYIFVGGLDFALTEGDIRAVFSQYGELVDINLVRDSATGQSKGYAFLCYEDQRSTNVAVDNFNGIKLAGRTIRVDHVKKYRKPKDPSKEKKKSGGEEEDSEEDEKEQRKREKRLQKEMKKREKLRRELEEAHSPQRRDLSPPPSAAKRDASPIASKHAAKERSITPPQKLPPAERPPSPVDKHSPPPPPEQSSASKRRDDRPTAAKRKREDEEPSPPRTTQSTKVSGLVWTKGGIKKRREVEASQKKEEESAAKTDAQIEETSIQETNALRLKLGLKPLK